MVSDTFRAYACTLIHDSHSDPQTTSITTHFRTSQTSAAPKQTNQTCTTTQATTSHSETTTGHHKPLRVRQSKIDSAHRFTPTPPLQGSTTGLFRLLVLFGNPRGPRHGHCLVSVSSARLMPRISSAWLATIITTAHQQTHHLRASLQDIPNHFQPNKSMEMRIMDDYSMLGLGTPHTSLS